MGGAGGGGGHAQQGPRLQPGGYAVWRPSMDVFLQRAGAEGIHKKATTADEWTGRSDMVSAWAEEVDADAMALLSLSGATSATS